MRRSIAVASGIGLLVIIGVVFFDRTTPDGAVERASEFSAERSPDEQSTAPGVSSRGREAENTGVGACQEGADCSSTDPNDVFLDPDSVALVASDEPPIELGEFMHPLDPHLSLAESGRADISLGEFSDPDGPQDGARGSVNFPPRHIGPYIPVEESDIVRPPGRSGDAPRFIGEYLEPPEGP